MFFDQSSEEVTTVESTAISTPLDSVPLYVVHFSKLLMILLKSSQAVSNSARFNLGTPAFHTSAENKLTGNYNSSKSIHITLES